MHRIVFEAFTIGGAYLESEGEGFESFVGNLQNTLPLVETVLGCAGVHDEA